MAQLTIKQIVVLSHRQEVEVVRRQRIGSHALDDDLVALELGRCDDYATRFLVVVYLQVIERKELRLGPGIRLGLGQEENGISPVLEVGDDIYAVAPAEQELVSALAAMQTVGVLATHQQVVAAVAEQPVFSSAAVQHIKHAFAAFQPVVARATEQRVAALATIELVIGVATVQFVVTVFTI